MKLLVIFCLCLFYSSVLTEKNSERTRTGVCPPSSERECFDQKTDCEVDEDCGGQTKCCSNGCVNKCVTPHYTGCQQLSLVLERQARSLGPEGKGTFIPRCDKSGKFEPVQCNDISEMCWCVNQQGFEIAGTRARSLNIVNCSAPDKCAGHTCRMLCPYGFELDDYGCPICECRDPCKGVKCPANQKCEVEEVPCVEEVCPPLPTCKQPRTLDSFCPVGEPITSPDSGHPILCGMEPNKPQCPHSYLCNVLPGNDYGVCCPLVDKQGTCPSEVDNEECGGSCQSDMDCVDVKKCCYSDVCGHTCVKPENTTLCLQQKAVVELLASNNAKFQGYVPQCTETGEFLPKQCTTNGALCWCVDSTGVQIRGTIGPSSTVDCLLQIRSDQNPDATVCKNTTCDLHCEFGFQYDDWGCVKCECDDPCQDVECPHGSECIVLKEDPCMSIHCPPVASCHRTQGDMCSKGRPLLDTQTQELVHCGENSCPLKTFVCEKNPEDDMGVCCPASFVIESSKEGNCPQYIAEPRYCGNNTCTADDECEGFKKCCPSDVCGAVCVNPEPKGLPTMCEYLHEMGRKLIATEADEFLAVSVPQCHEDGRYEPVQCNDGGECWCVDEFGVEINMTRASSFDQVDCRRVRARLECSGVLCRLGCDYGFEHDHAECPICACRNPCKDAKCPEGYKCQMTEVVCEDTWCPPIPKCMRVKTQSRNSFLHCPTGDPMLNENNIPMICNPQTGVQHCPDTHVCLVPDPVTPGICCPRSGEGLSLVHSSEDNLSVSSSTEKQNVSSDEKQGSCPVIESWEVGHCAEECNVDSDCSGPQKCCTNGCGAHVCRDPAGTTGKPGQCPYLVPQSLGSCEYECTSDYDCDDIKKCCSNGCGTQCLVPLTLTACQHQRAIAEYRAREAGIPASQVFLPLCDHETGVFKDVQCNPLTKECWCVDIHGYEVAGTRSLPGETTNCSGSTVCPVLACKMDCPAGLKLDESGCPLCECADPCREVICSSSVEECRLVQLTCSTDPCPPVPLCLPRISNPCQTGEPLIDVNTGNELKCGPRGSQCPSSHRCNLSPFGEFAVCCPKPRDICFAEKDVGRCKSSIPRWFFNAQKDLCEEFRFGGSGGNLNNFNYREDCEKTCHALSHCEKVRERNLKYRKHSNGAVFIPKCNKETGDWATVQCFDSIGLCWCASKDGEQVPGSIVRGTPHCTSRMGRTLDETSICPDGNPVYLCPANLCDNQHCLAHPNATCRVNPCRGCTPVFYDEMNHPVDCNDGLTTCARKVQKVLNSHAWANQGLPLNRIEDFLPVKLQHQNNSAPSLPFHFSLLLTSKKDTKHKEQDIEPVVKRSAWNTNPGLQMMTSRLSLMIGPEASNIKVRNFGNNYDMWDMIRPETTNTKIRLSGNNDNLWDMIRPEDTDTRIKFPGDNDNVWDIIRPEDTNIRIKFPMNNDNFWDIVRPEIRNMNIRFPGNNDNLWDMIQPEDTKMNIRFAGDNENLWDMIRPEDTNMNIRFAGDNGNLWEMVRPQATIMKFRLPDINENIWNRFFKINPFTPKLVKQGVCPIPSLSSVFRSMIQGCDNNCMVDSDCPGNRKCCITACGFDCLEPFISSQNTSPKSGTCPSKVLIDFSCSQPRRDCIVDHDCPASSKCCLTSCGPTCLQPQALPVEPVNMVVMPPTCSSDGSFAAAQSQGELSWCVDDGGNPLHNTLTRGLVTCDAKGRILGRQEIDPVCPGYDSKPRVCTDECFTAYCPQHPDAVCVADPCRDCATTFVNQAGEKVWCEDKCSQPLVVGNCRSSLPRYFYNKTSGSCEQFNFGGCEGNDNNFESLEECQETCELAVPVCDQPRDIGLCRGYVPRWFYNQQSHTCEEFIYGGCGGNENNFETKEECDARCPDLILCPWISVKGENLEPCSRMKACLNATCPANPVAVCTADPCSCKAVFVNNQTGKPVECFGESTSEPTHIVTPTVPRHTRCENSRQQHLADKTLENNYIAQCDLKGQFLPIQCAVSPNSVLYDEECWCVDEAGIQLPGTTTFPRGSQNCEPVKVKRVEVTLAFKHPSMDQASTSLDHVKRMIQQVLDDLAVDKHDTALETEIFKDRLHVNFNLTGDQKVDDAFHLENMIRGETVLHVSGVELPSDFRNSHFYHIIDYVPKKISKTSYLRDLGNKETEENKHKWNLSSTVICVIIVVTVVVVLLLLLLVIFMAQRQRGKQFEPKPPPTSIAFSSLIYGITDKSQNTKIPVKEKIDVQTVEAQYQSMLEKDDAVSELSEAPPGYDNISDHDVKV